MASPFQGFRKNQKILTVWLIGLSMFAFIFLDILRPGGTGFPIVLGLLLGGLAGWLLSGKDGKEAFVWAGVMAVAGAVFVWGGLNYFGNPTVVTLADGGLDRDEMTGLQNRRTTAKQFFGELQRELAKGDENLARVPPPEFDYAFARPTPFGTVRYGILGSPDDVGPNDDLLFGYLLGREADELGIHVTDDYITDQIQTYFGKAPSRTQYKAALRNMEVGESGLYDALRGEFRARRALELLVPTLEATPLEAWELYRRMNQRADITAAAVPVEPFLALAPEPTDGEVAELFEANKERYADPDTGLGFVRPPQVRVASLRADYATVREGVEPPTDDEVREYYDANRTNFRNPDYDVWLIEQGRLPAPDRGEPAGEPAAPPTLPGDPTRGLSDEIGDETPEPITGGESSEAPAAAPDDGSQSARAVRGVPQASVQDDPDRQPLSAPKPVAGGASDAAPEDPPKPPLSAPKPAPKTAPEPTRPAAEQPPPAEPAAEMREQASDEVPEKREPAAPDAAMPGPTPAEEPAAEKPAAEEPTTDAPAADPPAADGPATDREPPPEFRPLEGELLEELRAQLTEAKVRAAARAKIAAAEDALYRLAGDTWADLPIPDAPGESRSDEEIETLREAARETILGEMRAYAKQHGLEYEVTPFVGIQELAGSQEYAIGRAETASGNPFGGGTLAIEPLFERIGSGLFVVGTAVDPDTQDRFAFWKIADREAAVPKLDDEGVRERVVAAFKKQKARELAEARATELAGQARESKKPLTELFADATVTGKPGGEPPAVLDPGAFRWMRQSSAPNPGMMQQPRPVMGAVPEIGPVAPAFMETVFNELKPGGVGVAPNFDRSAWYVVRLKERLPEGEELDSQRPRFLREAASSASPYAPQAADERVAAQRRWIDELFRKYGARSGG